MRNLCLAFFALISSLCIFTSDGFEHLLGSDAYFWAQLEFITVITMAYPLLLYVAICAKKPWLKKAAYGLFATGILFFTTATILNFANVLHYCALLKLAHGITALDAIAIAIYAVDIREDKNVSVNMSAAFYTRRRKRFTVEAEKFDTCGGRIGQCRRRRFIGA